MQTSPEVLHQDLADFRVSHPDLTLLQYVDDILLTAETEQECLQEDQDMLDTDEDEKLKGQMCAELNKYAHLCCKCTSAGLAVVVHRLLPLCSVLVKPWSVLLY
ncbi:hypothetical protein STEG23_027920 [Scotinomys teguina]